PGNACHVDLCQELVQAVAEFMEQGQDFIVRERGGLARGIFADRRRKIAGEVGDGMLHTRSDTPPIDRVVHPRAALLARARVKIEVELADERTIVTDDLE